MKRNDQGLAFLLQYENVAWYEDGVVRILDRRIYPLRTEYVICRSHKAVAKAIGDMVTQSGGPYVAASMGMVLAAWEVRERGGEDALTYLTSAADTLAHARPTTAAKMAQITGDCLAAAEKAVREGKQGMELVDALRETALEGLYDRYERHSRLGTYLADVTHGRATIMTQCFAENIIGSYLRECRSRGYDIQVICPETRPYFQGARLTASVAKDMGFDVTVITDNMVGWTMKEKKVDLFTSAADVITMDGHIINKVGTFQMALCARYWGIPYYAARNPDPAHADLSTVVIEQRDPEQVLEAMGTRTTLPGVKGYYPAFDVTPPELCDGVVTEKGIFAPTDLRRFFR